MKACSLFFVLLAIVCLNAGHAADAATELLTEAQTAYLRGDFEAAKAKFQSVNKLDPHNKVAIGYLRILQAKEAERGASGNQEKQLANVIVPSVQFREAALSAVLEALKQQAAKLTNGKQAINFVIQLPPEQAQTSITLSLANVPFTEVLKYVGNLSNTVFVYDRYAITVKPAAVAGGTSAQTPAPPQ